MTAARRLRPAGPMFAAALGCALLAGPAVAEPPCVGAAFDIALPGATDVARRNADVSTARFAGLWQEGRVGGAAYQVFSDRTGMIADQLGAPTWRIDIQCDAQAPGCTQTVVGEVPDAARQLADALGRCLLGDAVTATDFAGISPDAETGLPEDVLPRAGTLSFDPAAAIATAAALAELDADGGTGEPGARSLPSCQEPVPDLRASQVRQIQTLLTEAGGDPGPIDGQMGARTAAAMAGVVGEAVTDQTTADALEALRTALCEE